MHLKYPNLNIFIINGYPCSGKDTFCNYVALETAKPVYTVSTVDWIKEIAIQCGWDRKKDLRGRKLLCGLKDVLTEYDNLPTKRVLRKIEVVYNEISNWYDEKEVTFFIMCREPQEIEKLKNLFNAKTVLVERKYVQDAATSNHADAEILNYNYDITIYNNKNLETLEKTAKEFVEKYLN